MSCVGDALEKKYGLAYDLFGVHGDMRFVYLDGNDLGLEMLALQIEMAAEYLAKDDIDVFFDQDWAK